MNAGHTLPIQLQRRSAIGAKARIKSWRLMAIEARCDASLQI